jgi:hypothetical protein
MVTVSPQLDSLEDSINLDVVTDLLEEICPVTFWSHVLTLPGAEKKKRGS